MLLFHKTEVKITFIQSKLVAQGGCFYETPLPIFMLNPEVIEEQLQTWENVESLFFHLMALNIHFS